MKPWFSWTVFSAVSCRNGIFFIHALVFLLPSTMITRSLQLFLSCKLVLKQVTNLFLSKMRYILHRKCSMTLYFIPKDYLRVPLSIMKPLLCNPSSWVQLSISQKRYTCLELIVTVFPWFSSRFILFSNIKNQIASFKFTLTALSIMYQNILAVVLATGWVHVAIWNDLLVMLTYNEAYFVQVEFDSQF